MITLEVKPIPPTIKAIAYCRVGTASQFQGSKAFDYQKQRLIKVAEKYGYHIVQWFCQIGSGVNSWEDIVLEDAHDFCKDNPEVSVLLATEPSRISRSYNGFGYWEQSFNVHGVTLKFTDHDSYDIALLSKDLPK